MKGYLILEDGSVFEGESVGAQKEVISEFVFNTSMTGYLEVLTDPSYAGQSVVMTYPLIGNYGVCLDDQESNQPHVEGFVVNELARLGSNFRKNIDLKDYLIEHDIPCIQGVDTRHITKIIRNKGCMNGMITTTQYDDLSEVLEKIHAFKVTGVVEKTTCDAPYTVGEGSLKVALYDFGAKKNIAKSLANRGIEVTVYPASTPASTIIEGNYDGVMLSNGPGDPEENTQIIEEIKKLIDSKLPIFAICLGHQLMALAHGFHTEKLKYGHHGANHPVKDLNTGRVYISTQNHNYVISEDSIDSHIAKPWFINVNDKTIEGMQYLNENIKTVQFHPEACAGPLDTDALFDEFVKMMEGE
ncbi:MULTISPECIES: carbamoyl phosphate synthase small subunit [Coprobacillaceae]|uniref:carbamoyl phosphate synthase small subunit n=1 Tax=Coprobacillaceae TaxID=2810280 RepID=UPI000E4C321C|nr:MULTISPECIES: carbamoyl phosphate synthase small subunit [Coprobacillaceae]RHM59000.1 carbamoyl phosphate synthase small subunit [Coprobacillus sp. AF33-1AC]RHS91384.1 carbamoyl phosphate synthase small subunit [Erysipelatoclostridium sp. AM42-17]